MTTGTRTFALVALIAACLTARPGSAGAQASAPGAPAAPRAPFSDLSAIRAIAADALQLVRNGDLRAAKARVEELEVQWRRAEAKMRPLSRKRTEMIDAAIDRVERELRFSRVRRTDSAAALEALIASIDSQP
jgi:hypothetical protein